PFEQLVDELQPRRDLSRSPLFQVMFVFERAALASGQPMGLQLKLLPIETTTAKFDLTLSIEMQGGALSASIEYNTDLFDRSTVVRMAGPLGSLAAAALAEPDGSLSDLPMLAGSELHQVLREWNAAAGPLAAGCIHEPVEEQAALRPDAIAAV